MPIVPRLPPGSPGYARPSTVAADLPDREDGVAKVYRHSLQELFALAEREIWKRPPQFEHWVYLHRWRVGEASEPPDEGEMEVARRQLHSTTARLRYRVHPERLLVVASGKRLIVADAVRGRMTEAGRLLADVARALRRSLSFDALCSRLRRRHSGSEVLEMVARLKVMGLLLEVAD